MHCRGCYLLLSILGDCCLSNGVLALELSTYLSSSTSMMSLHIIVILQTQEVAAKDWRDQHDQHCKNTAMIFGKFQICFQKQQPHLPARPLSEVLHECRNQRAWASVYIRPYVCAHLPSSSRIHNTFQSHSPPSQISLTFQIIIPTPIFQPQNSR